MKQQYQTLSKGIWQGRNSPMSDAYFYQKVKTVDLRSDDIENMLNHAVALIGFCSDEGVRRNCGRVGAAQGPDEIRRVAAAMAWDSGYSIVDLGNVCCIDNDLEQSQQTLASIIHLVKKNLGLTIVMGGGHETAWGHFQGLAKSVQDIAIVNFDAHFDLRPLDNNQGSSGTPFRQIAEFSKSNQLDFDYHCFGIQQYANTSELFLYAADNQVNYQLADDIKKDSIKFIDKFIDKLIQKKKPIYLSCCLDVFCSSISPGVSAPQSNGIYLDHMITAWRNLAASGLVCGMDIVECAPKYDIDNRTAKLAAYLITDFIHHLPT